MERFDEGSYERKEITEGNNDNTETNRQINQVWILIKKNRKLGGKEGGANHAREIGPAYCWSELVTVSSKFWWNLN